MISENDVINGTYRVVGEIGRGGAGIVYLAYHLRLEKYVVLKNSRLRRNDLEYLRNEVDTLKSLHHRTLPQVYDFLQLGDEIYTVIDYVDGADLEKHMQQGTRFDEETLLRFMLELADVLSYMHEHDPMVLHSDIKPANIILRNNGELCLIDFNIAVLAGRDNRVFGFSANYVSPEQRQLAYDMSAGNVSEIILDGRSDVFSLGSVMYFLVTGVVPNREGIPNALLQDIAKGYSRGFLSIIRRAMNPDPGQRYASAADLAEAIRKYQKRGALFVKRCICRAAVILVCGAMLTAGMWSLLEGLSLQRYEMFLEDYHRFQDSVWDGDSVLAIQLGSSLLNVYEERKLNNPDNWYSIISYLGDSSQLLYQQQGEERYCKLAQDFYWDAMSFALENYPSKGTDAMLVWGRSLVDNGNNAQLRQCADLGEYMNSEQRTVASAFVLVADGKTEEARAELNLLASADVTDSTRFAACSIMADICKNDGRYDSCTELLDQCRLLVSTEDQMRYLAEAYMALAEDKEDPGCYLTAARLYEQIILPEQPRLIDCLNCAVAYRVCGEYAQALAILEMVSEQYPERHSVLAQMALIYSQKGDHEQARAYARRALETEVDLRDEGVLNALDMILLN